jgi:DNA-binding NtrC family response regulator
MKATWRILVIDDEAVMRESLAAWLREDGYEVDTAASGREGIGKARETDYAIYFVDLKMPGGIDGIETMMEVKKLRPEASIVIITAYATVDTAITAMKEGALEYIVKPCNPQEISLLVTRIIRVRKLERENEILRRRLSGRWRFHDILSRNPRMQEIFALVRDVASLRSTVLVTGESGTGKELVARALHFSGERASHPFVGVSCAALSETLLESELFGHEKGAFTGASERRKGKFELAEGGSIFLDEIGDISPKVQVDLLRVLQERRFFRVGGSEEVSVDVRVVAATHVDLAEAVRQERFRDDLYYRLNVVAIHLPPLRERPEDIPLLARSFLERLAHELRKEAEDLSEGALKALLSHRWPGNVRELENAVERALVTAKGRVLTEEDFAFLRPVSEAAPGWSVPTHLPLADVEKSVIAATLRRNDGNVKETAAVLGIDRSTLYDKLKRYGIERP